MQLRNQSDDGSAASQAATDRKTRIPPCFQLLENGDLGEIVERCRC